MPMYNFIENSDAYSKTSGSLWQYHRDEPTLDNNNISIIDFFVNSNNSISFKFSFHSNIKKRTNRKRWHKGC